MSLFSGMSADKSADASADALAIIILDYSCLTVLYSSQGFPEPETFFPESLTFVPQASDILP